MYKIIYMGSYNSEICKTLMKFKNIKVQSVIVDKSITCDEIQDTYSFFEKHNIPIIELDEVDKINPDMIFVCGYTKIIRSELLKQYLFINIHAGILPKWRGINANPWAIVNGENQVGYSFHQVTDEIDGGDIYYKVTTSIDEHEKYGDARKRLNEIMQRDLEGIFLDIIEKKIYPESQKNKKYIYCSKFRKTDGEILNWNQNTSVLLGLYKVLGYPYGSGVYLFYKNKRYEIIEMRKDLLQDYSVGISGAIILTKGKSVWIKTLDGAVIIDQLKDENNNFIDAAKVLHIGCRL